MFIQSVNNDSLSPISFLNRSAKVYPKKTAVVYGDNRYSYQQFHDRICQLANALLANGIGHNDKVVFISPNIPPLLEAHFAIPMIGAVLVCVNTQLSAEEYRYIINHSDASVVFIDTEFASLISPVTDRLPKVQLFVNICDLSLDPIIDGPEYESFISGSATTQPEIKGIIDENSQIAINYTSGTTGLPKGVMYSHRATYLHSLGEIIESSLTPYSSYLWTLPIFHCNGWCFTWAVTAIGGTHVCLRKSEAKDIFHLIEKENISHMCASPTILLEMVCYPNAARVKLHRPLHAITAGASPTPAIVDGMEEIGINITHVYGLTELHGPHSLCAWQAPWVELDPDKVSELKARQGVPYTTSGHMSVVNSETMEPVPYDGKTMGEVVMRGNNVMLGYHKDENATEKAFRDGWFHSGDLGVVHPDGYIQIMDRDKDVIIKGGDVLSSMNMERLISKHPDVLEVAVVSTPDPVWGEAPKAFIVPKPGSQPTSEEIISFCRQEYADSQIPHSIEFGELPKTATGKTIKAKLRSQEWSDWNSEENEQQL